jgi:hypothetical protein
MKIYVLPVEKNFQLSSQGNIYPSHNKDYGVEQDFLVYLNQHPEFLTGNQSESDWHYLPIYWTRWHINHDYAKKGLSELAQYANKIVINPRKTFTICQYDDGIVIKQPITQLLSSRKTKQGIDIPLLSEPHKLPFIKLKRIYIASFMGRYSTHPIRKVMAKFLENKPNYYLFDGDAGSKKYVNTILRSYVALCPRGYGGSSFRFYEAMQIGVVPFLIGDLDTRPFKSQIDWNKCSFYTSDPKNIDEMIKSVSKEKLLEMGRMAKQVWKEQLTYQKWCNLALKALE